MQWRCCNGFIETVLLQWSSLPPFTFVYKHLLQWYPLSLSFVAVVFTALFQVCLQIFVAVVCIPPFTFVYKHLLQLYALPPFTFVYKHLLMWYPLPISLLLLWYSLPPFTFVYKHLLQWYSFPFHFCCSGIHCPLSLLFTIICCSGIHSPFHFFAVVFAPPFHFCLQQSHHFS